MVGIVLISHSQKAAEGAVELARMMAGLEGTYAARAHAAELLAEARR